jgi:uncharacterized protein (DUF362 family)/NAD-dependent dihydropyrimidine dehydrogenase PreA subunit
MKSKVAIIKCSNYNYPDVKKAVKKGIDLLGGVVLFVSKGEKILLKPNLLAGDVPGKAVTTHPMVFKATAELFLEREAELFYGDSPGKGSPERIAKQAGIKSIADELDVKLADFETSVKVSFPGAILAKQLYLSKGVLEADQIVSLCKMKTHGFTRITGAVKNQFGCIPGLRKAEYHVKMPDIYDFSSVLVDINNYLKPYLYIMDGIIAMQGNGPRGGTPVPMRVLLFSSDPVALDAVFCQLIDLDPQCVPYMKPGKESGLGTYKYDEIQLLGDDIAELINTDFQVVRKPPKALPSRWYFPTFLKEYVSPKPIIDPSKCTQCGSCILQCPVNPKAVNWPTAKNEKIPVYNYSKCIRCYCCQEICPETAISIKTPFLGKLLLR